MDGLLGHGALEVVAEVDGVAAAAARPAGAQRTGAGRVAARLAAGAQVQAIVPRQRRRRVRLHRTCFKVITLLPEPIH